MKNKKPKGKGWVYDPTKNKWFRIRKLTVREAFRLMDVDEDKINRLMATRINPKNGKEERVISNSQLYKMAGNSIVVNPMYLTFERFLFPEMGNYNIGDQLSLF